MDAHQEVIQPLQDLEMLKVRIRWADHQEVKVLFLQEKIQDHREVRAQDHQEVKVLPLLEKMLQDLQEKVQDLQENLIPHLHHTTLHHQEVVVKEALVAAEAQAVAVADQADHQEAEDNF